MKQTSFDDSSFDAADQNGSEFSGVGSGVGSGLSAAVHTLSASQPLAARMRPLTLDEFIGQQHILGPGKPLREAIRKS